MSEAYTPYGFAEKVLDMRLYDWQRDILAALMPVQSRVTLRAANESGKTSYIAAPFVLWHLAMFPGSQVVCTSGVWRQVTEQLWRPLRRYGEGLLGWKVTQDSVETTTLPRAKAIGFSTTDGGKFEGFHAEDHYKCPLAIIVDEAKSVSEEVFQGMERCRPTRWLIMSSPGAPQGGFYEYCNDPRFKHWKVTAFDCPHLGQKQADALALKYGRTSILYQSMIEAEWMNDPNQTYVCSQRTIDKCMATRVIRAPGRLIAAVDVAHAEGGNDNVLAVRYGNHIEIDCSFKGSGNANVVVDRLIERFQLRRLRPEDIWIDGDGIGSIYNNIFADKGWPLNIWRGQERAFDSNTYFNRSAEAWMNLARSIEKGELVIPADPEFHKQFTGRQYFINNKGQIQLEPKKDVKSPDKADAVTMVWSISMVQAQQFAEPLNNEDGRFPWEGSPSLYDAFEQRNKEKWHRALPPGCNVGI